MVCNFDTFHTQFEPKIKIGKLLATLNWVVAEQWWVWGKTLEETPKLEWKILSDLYLILFTNSCEHSSRKKRKNGKISKLLGQDGAISIFHSASDYVVDNKINGNTSRTNSARLGQNSCSLYEYLDSKYFDLRYEW